MYWLKACQKCGGDLYEGKDMYGPFVACLQCGRYSSEAKPARAEMPSPQRSSRRAVPADVAQLAA